MSEVPGRAEEDMDRFFDDIGAVAPLESGCGHGHVESLSEFHVKECPQRADRVRQVSRDQASVRRHGRGPALGIQTCQ